MLHSALRVLAGILAIAFASRDTVAQNRPGTTAILSLEEAHRLANSSNTDLLSIRNNLRGASAAIRSAYGAFLPRVSSSFSSSFQQGGSSIVSGALIGASSDVIQSSYSVGISMGISANSFIVPRVAKASRDALEADITGLEESVRFQVTQQYIGTLQAQARAALQDSLVISAETQLLLARAKSGAGAGLQLDVLRAEVAVGQAQAAALSAHNTAEIEMLRLFQRMGVPQPANVQLTSTFTITPFTAPLDSLLGLAQVSNPGLVALRSRSDVAALNVKSARGAYLPSLGISTGLGGHTSQFRDSEFLVARGRQQALSSRSSCLAQDSLRVGAGLPSILSQCGNIDFTESDAEAVRAGNNAYPFDFTKSPRSIGVSISLSLFDGFSREQRLADAQTSRDDAHFAVRAREQALTADISAAYLTLTSSNRTVALQQQNAAKAREELNFVQERYRVGSATIVELSDSRAQYERAATDLINAIYEFHKAFAALESAVGRPLR